MFVCVFCASGHVEKHVGLIGPQFSIPKPKGGRTENLILREDQKEFQRPQRKVQTPAVPGLWIPRFGNSHIAGQEKEFDVFSDDYVVRQSPFGVVCYAYILISFVMSNHGFFFLKKKKLHAPLDCLVGKIVSRGRSGDWLRQTESQRSPSQEEMMCLIRKSSPPAFPFWRLHRARDSAFGWILAFLLLLLLLLPVWCTASFSSEPSLRNPARARARRAATPLYF